MDFRFPTLSLFTIALLLSPRLLQAGITQTAPTPNSSQPTQPTIDRAAQAEADRLLQQGIQQVQTSQFRIALESLQQALSLYREIDDRRHEGAALSNMGLAYDNLGQYPQALEYYQQALAILRSMGDHAGEGTVLNNIGMIHLSLGQYPQALEQLQQALAISRAVGDRAGEGVAINNIGTIYWKRAQYSQALEYYQQALAIHRTVGDRAGEEATLNNIGTVQDNLGQYSRALEYYQQALTISRTVGDHAGEGAILNNIGVNYWRLGQYLQALEYHQQALAIRRAVGDRAGEGTTLNNIGTVQDDLGQYSRALEYYQQALAIRRAVSDRAGEGTTLHNIGGNYRSLGQYSQALEYYQQALAIRRALGDRAGEGTTLNGIGTAQDDLGQYSQALEYYQQALAISKVVGDRVGEGVAINNIGANYWRQGQYPQALEQLQQALVISRAVGDRAGEGTTLNNIGTIYSWQGQYPQALEYYQQALVISRAVGDHAGEGQTLSNTGAILLETGQFAAAIDTLFRAIEAQEALRAPQLSDASKIALIDTQGEAYDFLQQTLITQNEVEAALEVAERARARAFVELLSQQASSASEQQIAVSAPTIAQIQQIAHQQNATLVEYSIASEPVRTEGRVEWRQSKLYIWVVKPTGEVAFRSVDLTATDVPPLDMLINASRQTIGVRGRGATPLLPPQIGQQPGQTNLRLQQLYQLLIEPIADLLPINPNEHVVFIPQRDLFSVPFSALQDANGKYLIENHTILTVPAIQVLGLTQHSQPGRSIDPSQALIVGNPTMPALPGIPLNPPPQLSALPGAEQEAIAIARQFHTQPLLGDAATETTVTQRMTSAQIIHLATHGLLDYGDPQASGVRDLPGAIALAPSAQDDGLLTSSEILNMRLKASLVVLSACDTGRGRITADGVVGLSRSLLSAGASSVIVSLWKVPDDATEELMTEFYRQLSQQPDKAQALRQAMLQTMQQHPDPIDWAAFTLIGESE